MLGRKPAAWCGVVLLGAWLSGSAVKGAEASVLTFHRPVSLPGVKLAAGTYLFELIDARNAWPVVRVSSVDRRTVYYAGFTQPVERRGELNRKWPVSFGEAPLNGNQPITVWWPPNEEWGYQFMYV